MPSSSGEPTVWPTCCAPKACDGWTTTRSSWRTTIATSSAAAAGERSGLYYTCINSYLTAEELAYIVDNSESQVLVTSIGKLPVARAALDIARESSAAW